MKQQRDCGHIHCIMIDADSHFGAVLPDGVSRAADHAVFIAFNICFDKADKEDSFSFGIAEEGDD